MRLVPLLWARVTSIARSVRRLSPDAERRASAGDRTLSVRVPSSRFDARLAAESIDPNAWRQQWVHARAPATLRPRFAISHTGLPADIVAVAIRGAAPGIEDLVIVDSVATTDAAIDRAVRALAIDPAAFDPAGAPRTYLIAADGMITYANDGGEQPVQWGPLAERSGDGRSERRRMKVLTAHGSAVPPMDVAGWSVRLVP